MQVTSKVLTVKEALWAALNGESFLSLHDSRDCKHEEQWGKATGRLLELMKRWTVLVCEKFVHWSREHYCVHIQT